MMGQARGFEVNWNQLIQNGNFDSADGFVVSGGGSISVVNNEATITKGSYFILTHNIGVVSGTHIFAGRLRFYNSSENVKGSRIEIGSAGASGLMANPGWNTLSLMVESNNCDRYQFYPYQVSPNGDKTARWVLQDLTQMFGSGNEPTTVAEFESWLQENGINPNEYIPYNTGETRIMTKPSWIQ